jgi:hypothetical protein
MRITPYATFTLEHIHKRTSLCQLFFPAAPKSQGDNPHSGAKAEKTGFQTAADQQS